MPAHQEHITAPFYKKPAFLAIAVLVLIAGFFLLRDSGGSMSTPEGTIKALVNALDDADIKTIASLYAPEEQPDAAELEEAEEFLNGMMEDVKFDNLEIIDVSVDGDKAHVEYRVDVSFMGETNTDKDVSDLIRINGKWYIDDSFAF
ncbi:hypothetical protein DNH61_02100 [Paenibacillus sambharensis]|uniref:YchJ-like middle NTF2-like domain-containing protein n=2 Tax=Paenibacillus sambharensis TaxID=1803190 RepID=A0A2W1M1F4_9BACL|nr:hypothetical protein DNH61_02100 [Paenibacillus sambharensis]